MWEISKLLALSYALVIATLNTQRIRIERTYKRLGNENSQLHQDLLRLNKDNLHHTRAARDISDALEYAKPKQRSAKLERDIARGKLRKSKDLVLEYQRLLHV